MARGQRIAGEDIRRLPSLLLPFITLQNHVRRTLKLTHKAVHAAFHMLGSITKTFLEDAHSMDFGSRLPTTKTPAVY